MIATFETKDYGKIEIDKEDGAVYFYKEDYCTKLDADGDFKNYWGSRFHVCWPILPMCPDALLQVWTVKEVGRRHHTEFK